MFTGVTGDSAFMIPVSPISSSRLSLTPVTAAHAEEMFAVLDDEKLYEFIGGVPPGSVGEVQRWFSALESRESPDGKELWLTWIVHTVVDPAAIGYVQATVSGTEAEIAWLIGTNWQSQGYASEASRALIGWLREQGVDDIRAWVNPGHEASLKVARTAGLHQTATVKDGETLWRCLGASRRPL